MIKLIVMVAIVVVGLIYFDVLSLNKEADAKVKEMVDSQVEKGKEKLQDYKDEALEKLKKVQEQHPNKLVPIKGKKKIGTTLWS